MPCFIPKKFHWFLKITTLSDHLVPENRYWFRKLVSHVSMFSQLWFHFMTLKYDKVNLPILVSKAASGPQQSDPLILLSIYPSIYLRKQKIENFWSEKYFLSFQNDNNIFLVIKLFNINNKELYWKHIRRSCIVLTSMFH
jgi:hypothetical protein